MSDKSSQSPITDKTQLVGSIEQGCKPKERWLIGTEHEKFPLYRTDLSNVFYEGPKGIEALLKACQLAVPSTPIVENDKLIGLSLKNSKGISGGSITLEPGGQFELSGAALPVLHETHKELEAHFDLVTNLADQLGICFVALGFHPLSPRADVPHMPKARYDIMRSYMPKVGSMGLDMMYRTCTVQVNMDFSSEPDMVKMFRTSLALQPLATALFANSTLREGQVTEFQSFRSNVWLDVDNDRAGMLPFVFEEGMGFERYVDYALDVPMYFVYRDGTYIDCAGQSFRDFLDGTLKALPKERPTMKDWENHLTTIFPEVRLKSFLEMRGADAGPRPYLLALPAFWTGLFYDKQVLDEAYELIKPWTATERQALRDQVPQTGLHTVFQGRTLFDLARDVLVLCAKGLKNRKNLSPSGYDESLYLSCLFDLVDKGQSQSDQIKAQAQKNDSIDQLLKPFII